MPLDPQQVGKRLTELRELQGRSLSEVAEAAGIAKSYLLKLERGEVENPGLATLDTVAKTLKVTLAKLLSPTGKTRAVEGTEEHSWEWVEARMPESLKAFLRTRENQEKVPADIKQSLATMKFRGSQPKRPEDWELIYLAFKRAVERR